MTDFTPQEAQLLTRLQRDLPRTPRPFTEIGAELGIPEAEVLATTRALLEGGFIRELSGLFDTRALGYDSILVAAEFPAERLDDAAAIIGAHPGVSHNYAREGHAYNLWFTLALPPDSRLGLRRTLAILARRTEARRMAPLPALRTFKLTVNLDLSGDSAPAAAPAAVAATRLPNAEEIALIRLLQEPFPITEAPYGTLAAQAGLTPDACFDGVQRLYTLGYLRRLAAVLRHRKVGFTANGMGTWDVPANRVEEVGNHFATAKEVSHCYERPRAEGWPYNLFTMVHAHSREECLAILARLADEVHLPTPNALFSTKEYKKARVKYYAEALHEWEAAHLNE
jgi:DNA-binding Lrp family transcriptional regulator